MAVGILVGLVLFLGVKWFGAYMTAKTLLEYLKRKGAQVNEDELQAIGKEVSRQWVNRHFGRK